MKIFTLGLVFALSAMSYGAPIDVETACDLADEIRRRIFFEELPAGHPMPEGYDTELCKQVIVFRQAKLDVNKRLSKNDKKDCLMEEFENSGLFAELVDIKDAKKAALTDNKKLKLREIEGKVKAIFSDAAKKCDSDETYGGRFDDELGLSPPKNYCVTKYLVENVHTHLLTINLNPENIPTRNLDCDSVVTNVKAYFNKELNDVLEIFKESERNCIKTGFESEKFVNYFLMLGVSDSIEASLEDKEKFLSITSGYDEEKEILLKSCQTEE